VRDEGVCGDVGCYGAEEEGAGGVAHPGVELTWARMLAGRQHQFDGGRTIGFVRAKFGVAEVVACGLGFLAEGHEVGRIREVLVELVSLPNSRVGEAILTQ